MRLKVAVLGFLALAMEAWAQAPVTSITLDRDQIGIVKTAQGITTRIAFQEPVKEIVCGDLYDPSSGKGSFVVQRSDNDVFLKPIAPRGFTNLFIKTGERGEHVYNFDLMIVAQPQAYRVVNVSDNSPTSSARLPGPEQPGDSANDRDLGKHQSDEILRAARQQAGRIIAEAEQQAADVTRQAGQKAAQEIEQRFVRALMFGVLETKLNTRAAGKRVVLALDSRVLTFDGKAYLRFTIQNNGAADVSFGTVSLELGAAENAKQAAAEIIQSKVENRLKPAESMAGVVVFDPKLVETKEKLALYLRAEDGSELVRAPIF